MSNNGNIDLTPLATALEKAKNIVCFVHPQATYDAVAAALAFSQAIEQTGRSATVACEAPMRPEYSQLSGINQVRQEVGNRDLVISFDYTAEQVDKVNYNVDEENKRFELIITPQKGGETLDPRTVEFKQAGLSVDVVVLFGFHSFEEMGAYYTEDEYTINSAFSVAITQSQVKNFAKLHSALQPHGLSYSEWVFFALRQLQIPGVKDGVATNLLAGIEYATQRLQQIGHPRTFETLAQLMHAGAQRLLNNPAFEYLAMPIQEASVPQQMPQPVQMSAQPSTEWTPPQMDTVPNGPSSLNNA